MIFYDAPDEGTGLPGSGGIAKSLTQSPDKPAGLDPFQQELEMLNAMTVRLLQADHGAGTLNDWQQAVQSGGVTAREFYNQTGRISALTGQEQQKGEDDLPHGLVTFGNRTSDSEWNKLFHGEHSPKPGSPAVPLRNPLKPSPVAKLSPTGGTWVGEVGVKHGNVIQSPYGFAEKKVTPIQRKRLNPNSSNPNPQTLIA